MSRLQLSTKVPASLMGKRFDAAMASLFPDYSRSRIQEWIKQGWVQLDGKVETKLNLKVFGGEDVLVDAQLDDVIHYEPQQIDLDVVYEDDTILVINKPVGMVVHPGAGNPDGTLLNALLYYYPAAKGLPRAGIVHRLDKDTSGLMVVAKTLLAHTHLVEQLQRHAVERVYDAVTMGRVISGGTVNKMIGRHPHDRKKMAAVHFGGKPAVSHYRVLERFREHTYVRVQLETGRTHQIRVHMSSIGFPLVGDSVYGARFRVPKKMAEESIEFIRGFQRQALHAGLLSLTHPLTHKVMKWKAPMPDDMMELLDVLREDLEEFSHSQSGYDDFDYDYGVEVEWVTDEDIPD